MRWPHAPYIIAMIKRLLSSILGAGLLLSPMSAAAAPDSVYTNWRNNIAVEGFDVVTFFSGKPQQGKAAFSTRYEGAHWYFYNQANMDLFLTNPAQFSPQYGGYCAWAVAKGKLAPGKAKHWHVEDGKLYLNFSGRIKRRWHKEQASFIDMADTRWPALLED